jgi:hypothetical protein
MNQTSASQRCGRRSRNHPREEEGHLLKRENGRIEGVGLCQRKGGPIEVIRPGDRIFFEPDENHWHGATADRLLVHLAINEVDDEHPAVHWGEHVTDEEYACGRT